MQETSSPSTPPDGYRNGTIKTVITENEAIYTVFDKDGGKFADLIVHKGWSSKEINKLLRGGLNVTAVRSFG